MSIIEVAKKVSVLCMALLVNQSCRKNKTIEPGELQNNFLNTDRPYSVSEAYSKRDEIDQMTVRLTGFLHSVNGHLYLMESPDSQRKIDIPEYPFLLENESWSREIVLTGKYQLSGNLSSDVVSPVSQIEITNPNNRR